MKQTERKNGKRFALGLCVTLVTYLGLLAMAALLLTRGRVGERHAELCVTVCMFIAAFAGAKTALWGAAQPAVPVGETLGVMYCLILLFGFLTNDTLEVRRAFTAAAAMAMGGGCALILRIGKRDRKRARRNRR